MDTKITKHETVVGYDGNGYTVGDRVELHPGTDLWMRGARYGSVVGLSLTPNDRVRVRLDKLPRRVFSGSAGTFRFVASAETGLCAHRSDPATCDQCEVGCDCGPYDDNCPHG